ncbi:NusG domain II-containing protein [Paratissierella segnis]|uniref:NusG domain II-containing protein n=1 Tax=Paratissierella segnis TaxID=2763679 RepID=A0A926EV47_9FIRM|nr:NusG domain II-containing protein [Paratissierella segnis]MBC8588848.1 NusG domain II-containing protein [Paratissierella segnis]
MTKGDKLLIVFVIILSFLSMGYINKQAFSNDSKYVSVQVNGKEVKKIIFDKKIIGTTIPLKTEYGYNLIEIGDEKVRVIEADCPDKIDVKQGYISRIGETIVCLPNKMVIEIKGLEEDTEIDIMNH